MHLAMYLYDPTSKYPIAHPRAFARVASWGIRASPIATAAGPVARGNRSKGR